MKRNPTGNHAGRCSAGKQDRRTFVREAGLGVAGLLSAPRLLAAKSEGASLPEVPPHRGLALPGIHGYADRKSVRAGEAIQFHISSQHPYRLSIRRLGPRVDDRASDLMLHEFSPSPAEVQPIFPGSYVLVPSGIAPTRRLREMSLECWVRPWRLDRLQGLLTQYDYPERCGFGLFLSANGRVCVYLGDGEAFRDRGWHIGPKIRLREWSHLVASWDGKGLRLWHNGLPAGEWRYGDPVSAGAAPLRLAAGGRRGQTDLLLDGDLAMPVIWGRRLLADEVGARFKEKGSGPARGKDVYACWPFDEEKGETLEDVSPHRRRGWIVNRATWMIGGPAFRSDQVARFGSYDPKKDLSRGHGIRFASDDLYDCGWRATHRFRVPASARQGIYVGRIDTDTPGKHDPYDITFVVTRGRRVPKAPILVLCSTNTWLAYNATPFAKNGPSRVFWGTTGRENSHPDAPAYCFYRDHIAEQPTYQIGLRMPWPAAAPGVLYSPDEVGYSHLMRGERFLHVWLEEEGYRYDIATDLDLHQTPDLLQGYKTLVINGHSEYWSAAAYEGLGRYLRQGGSATVLSGNTMFWRVSFNEDGSVIECRKYGDGIGGRPRATPGELYHTLDGRKGSLMRECGYPAWRLVGLECDGWAGRTGPEDFGVFETRNPDHFLFSGPEPLGLSANQTFGHGPNGSLPRAIGHEWDVRIPTLVKVTRSIPREAVLPLEPDGIVTLAQGLRKGGGTIDYFCRLEKDPDPVCCEMIYWERPQGGKIFNAGTIGFGWALERDPRLQGLLRNVFHHLGVRPG